MKAMEGVEPLVRAAAREVVVRVAHRTPVGTHRPLVEMRVLPLCGTCAFSLLTKAWVHSPIRTWGQFVVTVNTESPACVVLIVQAVFVYPTPTIKVAGSALLDAIMVQSVPTGQVVSMYGYQSLRANVRIRVYQALKLAPLSKSAL